MAANWSGAVARIRLWRIAVVGQEAIRRMCAEHPSDFVRVLAGLVPKELLLEVATPEKANWVINASPQLSVDEWRIKHSLEIPAIEVDQ